MGRIKSGLLGGFSGKIGPIIGYQVRGKNFIKGIPKKYSKEPTPAQLASRLRFALIQNWRSEFTQIFAISFRNHQYVHNPQNAAHRYNAALVQGEYPNYYLEPKNACISMGTLALLQELKIENVRAGEISLTWDLDTSGNGKRLDFIGIVSWNPANKLINSNLTSARRKDEKLSYQWDATGESTPTHLYLACFSEDWSNASITHYLGAF
ncbi:MAG: hypothetical protein EOO99_08405 [Pedobacter sp.]|nr:MAG: hypothetical protein EOO99_08405 [Pedobacter sp.]